jgi:D-beta-D-heptose 7-phosphate kinase/D-beta-D-heptose 1-phosphate adenosyltransferase
VTLADGCFDPVHWGHLQYLLVASHLDPPLVVHIAPDEAILAKGRTPFQSRQERAMTLLALGCVDRVRMWPSLADAIDEERPRYLVKGAEWRGKLPEDVLGACQRNGVEIVYTDVNAPRSRERL